MNPAATGGKKQPYADNNEISALCSGGMSEWTRRYTARDGDTIRT